MKSFLSRRPNGPANGQAFPKRMSRNWARRTAIATSVGILCAGPGVAAPYNFEAIAWTGGAVTDPDRNLEILRPVEHAINDSGEIVLVARTTGDTQGGLFVAEKPGEISTLAVAGQSAGPRTRPIIGFNKPDINNHGDIAVLALEPRFLTQLFPSTITGVSDLRGIVRITKDDRGQPLDDIVAWETYAIPSNPTNAYVASGANLAIDDTGQVVFNAKVAGPVFPPNVPLTFPDATFSVDKDGNVTAYGYPGSVSDPDTGALWWLSNQVVSNDKGEVAWRGSQGASYAATIGNFKGYLSESGGDPEDYKEIPNSDRFNFAADIGKSIEFFSPIALNNTGQILFESQIVGTGTATISSYFILDLETGEISTVAIRGQEAADTGLKYVVRRALPSFNDVGQVLFSADTVAFTGQQPFVLEQALFMGDGSAEFETILSTGDFLKDPFGVEREVRQIASREKSLSDNFFAFEVGFDNGTWALYRGELSSAPAPVPLPAGGWLLCVGIACLVLRSRPSKSKPEPT